MSALTVTDTLSAPEALAVVCDVLAQTERLPVDAALAVVRAILAQTDGDAVLLALTERVVWPLTPLNQRFCVNGCVAMLRESVGVWYWEVYASPTGHPSFTTADRELGRASTREGANAAVTAALRRRGFHCVGAP